MTLLILLLVYFIGSIPFGLLLTRWAGLGDVREIGSGNIGATNVLRTGNKKLALATLLLDIGKGYLAVTLAFYLVSAYEAEMNLALLGIVCAPFVAVFGHTFPVWLHFKGGKGVATAIGAIAAFYPFGAIVVALIWLAVFAVWRISSLAALISLWTGPVLAIAIAYLCGHPMAGTAMQCLKLILPIIPVIILVTMRHHANIKRLLHGTEPRFTR